jgi:hypothetical protein
MKVKGIAIITSVRPALYVEFWSLRMQFMENETIRLIQFCLNCIRCDQNSTYETTLNSINFITYEN